MKKVSRRISLICLLLLLLTLAACHAEHEPAPVQVDSEDMTEQPGTSEPVPEITQEAAEKTVLTIASIGGSRSALNMVVEAFNRQSEQYQVQIIDYAEDVTPAQGKLKLQTEILAGNVPDMLLFDIQVYFTSGNYTVNALSPLSFLSQNMLMNLDSFIDAEADLCEDDFVIWNALHEFGGMYFIGPKFYVRALCCTQETAEKYKNWTLEDYLTLQEQLTDQQDLIYGISPTLFIRRIASHYIHDAVDIETATCDFNNPDFIRLLKTGCQVNQYNTEDRQMQADGSFKSAPEMLVDGELMFYRASLFSVADVSFDRWRAGGVRVWYGEGEDPYAKTDPDGVRLAYIGYPTPDGSNGMYVEFPYSLGICEKTEHPDACWTFFRYMLENPMYQDYNDGTPVLYRKLDDNLSYIESEHLGWKTTKDDLDQFVALASECISMSYYDEDIIDIIEEEAEEVLAGAITAETAAERIQNRANILVMERYG